MGQPAQHFYINLKIKNKSGVNTSITELHLAKENIEYITITEHILTILPKIEMVLNDVGGLTDAFPLLDDDVMSVVISQYEGSEPMVEMDFIISDYEFEYDAGGNHYNKMKLVGYAKSKDVFVPYKNRSFNGNSEDVLRTIAKETGIKFANPHNVSPSDKMIWYQDSNNHTFIKHILKRAYIVDDALFFYGTTKNEFVYTSLRPEIEKEIKFTAKYNLERVDNFMLMDNENDIMFFNSYDVVNMTGIFNKMNNYAATFGYYNLQGEYIGGTVDKISKLTDLYNKSKDYDGMPSMFYNIGMFGNNKVFEEFPRGIVQNMFMKYNLFSTSILLNINSMTDVKLFDKVTVGIPAVLNGDFNEVYSGDYLVTAITHNITSDGVYQKKPLLCRNGINKSGELKDYNVN